jgi:hypothetical protein
MPKNDPEPRPAKAAKQVPARPHDSGSAATIRSASSPSTRLSIGRRTSQEMSPSKFKAAAISRVTTFRKRFEILSIATPVLIGSSRCGWRGHEQPPRRPTSLHRRRSPEAGTSAAARCSLWKVELGETKWRAKPHGRSALPAGSCMNSSTANSRAAPMAKAAR